MSDQAEGLRLLATKVRGAEREMRRAHQPVLRPTRRIARTMAVTSGKGGVGKTNVTLNLGIEAARRGRRVLVVDADWGLANLDVILGVTPELNLAHFLAGQAELDEIICEGPEGVQIIPNGSGLSELANMSALKQQRIFRALQELEGSVDILMVDTGAGISDKVLNFVYSAGEALVVATPEPTSIRDAYAAIKTIIARDPRSKIGLIVNMASDAREGREVGERVASVVHEFLNRRIELLGWILHDRAVQQSVRSQRPFVLAYPQSPAARSLAEVADGLFGVATDLSDSAGEGFFGKMARLLGGRVS